MEQLAKTGMRLNKARTQIICVTCADEDDMWGLLDIVPTLLQSIDYSLHKEKSSMKHVVGYTTRSMNAGERNGSRYIHLSEMPNMKMGELLMYKMKNKQHYWFKCSQMKAWDKNLIVCSREDAISLKHRAGKDIDGWAFDMVWIDVDAKPSVEKWRDEDKPDYVLSINSHTNLETVHKKCKMLHSFLAKKKKGLWL